MLEQLRVCQLVGSEMILVCDTQVVGVRAPPFSSSCILATYHSFDYCPTTLLPQYHPECASSNWPCVLVGTIVYDVSKTNQMIA